MGAMAFCRVATARSWISPSCKAPLEGDEQTTGAEPITDEHSMKTTAKIQTIMTGMLITISMCASALQWKSTCDPWAGTDSTNCGTAPGCTGTCVDSVVIAGPPTGGWCVPATLWCQVNGTGTVTLVDTTYRCTFTGYSGCICGKAIIVGNPVTTHPRLCASEWWRCVDRTCWPQGKIQGNLLHACRVLARLSTLAC